MDKPGADDDAKSKKARKNQLAINTNLTEISDWLCKIIVGLGLIELRNIPVYIYNLSQHIARDMGDINYTSFVSGLLVFFFALGFLMGYLLTRLRYSILFSIADESTVDPSVSEYERRTRIKMNKIAIMSLENYGLLVAQQKAGSVDPEHLDEAIQGLEKILSEYPDQRRAAMILSNLYGKHKRDRVKAREVLSKVISELQKQGSLNETNKRHVADLSYNIACFYALEAKDAIRGIVDPQQARSEYDRFKRLAAETLTKSVQLKPANKQDALTEEDFAQVLSPEEINEIN